MKTSEVFTYEVPGPSEIKQTRYFLYLQPIWAKKAKQYKKKVEMGGNASEWKYWFLIKQENNT